MNEEKITESRFSSSWNYLLWGAGLLLLTWQIFTFLEVLEVHTAQAQKISQSASWAGKPVGTMVQALESSGSTVEPLQQAPSEGVRIMHTALPWSD